MRRLFLHLAILLATTAVAPLAQAALALHVDIDRHVDPLPGASNVPPDSHVELDVTLEDRSFVVRHDRTTSVFDFSTRKRSELDEAKHTRVDFSLYDTVGFRVLELENRARLARALEAAKVPADQAGAFGAVDNQHLLSVQDAPASPLQTSEAEGQLRYQYQGRLFGRESLKGTPVTPHDARLFAQLIRYLVGGHPQILEGLAAAGAIPDEMEMRTYEMGVRTTTIHVRSVRPAGDMPVVLADYAKRAATADESPIDRVLDRAAALTPAQLDAGRKRNAAELEKAFADDRLLDAMLTMFEANLMTGTMPFAATAERIQRLRADPNVAKLTSVAGATTREQVAAALPVLAELRAATTGKAYVVDIFIANDRKTLGETVVARDLFVKVLDANPQVAGVYKDLGDALLMTWDLPHAWRSFDVGRLIAPQFANFRAVDQFEQSLATKHPEYF